MTRDASTIQRLVPLTAVVADDHAIVRNGLRQILDQLRIETVAEASSGIAALAAVKAHEPDVVLLDVLMPHAQGTEVIQEIRRWHGTTKIVVYTGVTKAAFVATLVESGIDGLFLKSSDLTELKERLPFILDGARYISQEAADLLSEAPPLPALSSRELQVLHMLIAGGSNRQIGERLSISAHTVDKHRSNLMAKLQVHSFAELMQYAVEHDLVGSALDEP